MIRARRELVTFSLLLTYSTLSTHAFDWTLWNDPTPNLKTLAPASVTSPTSTPPSTPSSSSANAPSSGASWKDLDLPAEHAVATPSTAVKTFHSVYRNWVGPWTQSPDSGCYREAHIMKTCPRNYDRSTWTHTCWAECPMDYPVECGMQCIQQNNHCGRENLAKSSAVAMATLSMATFGVFGELAKMGKAVGWAVRCTNMLLVAVRAIVRFTRNQLVQDPQTSQQKLLLLLYQTNWVVADLPATIYVCMGKPIPPNLLLTRSLLPTVQFILLLVLNYADDILTDWGKFKAFMLRANFTAAASAITEGEISSLETAMQSNATCSDDLRSATNLVWSTINELRAKHPGISEADMRLKLSKSDLILYDIPTVTNNCMVQMIPESTVDTAYKTRETLRKTFGVMINDLIKDGTSDNGTTIAVKHSTYVWTRNIMWIASVTLLDPTDLSTLFSEFLQTICGPTQFMGEIDDGDDDATLGLHAMKHAFQNTTSSWRRKGDGQVLLNFQSQDTKDVVVNIRSGGDKIGEVKVKAGGTAHFVSTVKQIGGKTLYFDRWRPGFLGLPRSGGGTLTLWVPISREGGHLELNVQVNAS